MPEEKRLLRMLAEQFGMDEENLDRDLPIEKLDLDSLETLEFLNSIEDEFDIELADHEFVGCETLGEVADLIIDKVRS